jgi:hypothetical protein
MKFNFTSPMKMKYYFMDYNKSKNPQGAFFII